MNWRLKDSDIFLQKKNGDNIDLLRHRDLDYHCYSNQFNEISFVVDRPSVDKQSEDNIDENIANELKTYDLLLDEQIAYIPELGHFCISVDVESDGNESKTVSGKSWEYELSRKYLQDFQANTMEEGDATDSNGDFITTILFDESNRDRSLLHRVLKDTGWSIRRKYDTEKYVAMSAEVRTYDIQWQDVYSFISDLQNELDIVFEYDKYERIITWCLLEDYGKDTGVFITLDNLAKKIDVTTDESKLFTEVVIYGGDGIDVNQVIPAYTSSIFKPDYFLDEKYMSRDTIDAYNYYKDYYNSVVDTYPNYMIEADEYNEKYLRYLNAKPLSETIEAGTKGGTIKYLDEMTESELDAAFTWNEDSEYNYGRNHLSQIIDSYTEAKETLGANSSAQGQEYYNHILLVIKVATSHLGIIDLKISEAKTKRDSASGEASAIKQSCDLRVQFRKYFSETKGLSGYDLDIAVEKAYQEINSFRFPTEYTNENYIVTDDEASDYSTVLKYTKELVARAEKELDSSCVPYITWKCDVVDLKDMNEFSELLNRDDLDVGDFLWVELHEGFNAKVRITEYSYTHEDPDSFSIDFADRIETSDAIADVAERIGAATSVASQMEYYAKQMSAYDEAYRNVREILDYGLDASKTMIYNNVGQEVITDEYGILGRKQIAGNIYSPEALRVQSNQIIFTDNNWETVRTALGKIAVRTENGVEYKYGLIADTILVEDLYSLNADIGKWKIGADALYSKNFAINEDGTIASGLYLGSDGKFLAKYLQMSEDVFNLNVAGVRITAGDKNVSWNDYIGDINQQNKDYVDGVQGGNIAAIEVEYYLSSSTSLLEGGTWSTVAPEWQDGMYMWQRTKTVYKNGTIEYSDPTCIAGASGKDGSDGKDGNDGKGVDSTEISYQASSDGTTPPSGEWSANIPTVSDGQYLWTRTVISYTDGTKSTSYSVARQGTSGSTGVGVKNTSVTYQEGTSGTTAPSGTWSGSIPSVSEGNYLWTRTIVTYTDDTTSTSYSVAYHGTNGDAGEDAISLVISSSGGIIFKNTNIATTLTAHVYKGGQEVTGTALSALGTIKWYKDGGSTAVATGQTLTISAGDISNRATYVAQLES